MEPNKDPSLVTSGQVEWLKRYAKKLKKEKNIPHMQALDIVSTIQFNMPWRQLMTHFKQD